MKKWIFLFLAVFSLNAFAAGLKDNEAYVVLGIEGKNHDVSNLRFKEFTTGKSVTVQSRSSNRPKKIKAGDYYLERIIPQYNNISPIIYNAPTSVNDTFSIEPGTVTYIGVWQFNKNSNPRYGYWEILRDYSLEYLADATKRKREELMEMPLRVITDNGEVFEYEWADVMALE